MPYINKQCFNSFNMNCTVDILIKYYCVPWCYLAICIIFGQIVYLMFYKKSTLICSQTDVSLLTNVILLTLRNAFLLQIMTLMNMTNLVLNVHAGGEERMI